MENPNELTTEEIQEGGKQLAYFIRRAKIIDRILSLRFGEEAEKEVSLRKFLESKSDITLAVILSQIK